MVAKACEICMTTPREVTEVAKQLRCIIYSWIGVPEIAELKNVLLPRIEVMLKEYRELLKEQPKDIGDLVSLEKFNKEKESI